ncbi:MAG: hypothetical protein AABX65_00040 [Nanoarchaeota archaeon]
MGKILADTSFIMSCVKQGIDIKSEFDRLDIELVVPDLVFYELKELASAGNAKEMQDAELALQLLHRQEAKIIELLLVKNVDNSIIEFAIKNSVGVATLDRGIKNKLWGKVPVVFIKDKKSVEIG